MLRPLLSAAATLVAIWGTALGAAPVAVADVPDINCIKFNEDGSCYYENCTEARQNHECNIPPSSPHYCRSLDRDGDGRACACKGYG
jgi:Excalibur calcium-binding domain